MGSKFLWCINPHPFHTCSRHCATGNRCAGQAGRQEGGRQAGEREAGQPACTVQLMMSGCSWRLNLVQTRWVDRWRSSNPVGRRGRGVYELASIEAYDRLTAGGRQSSVEARWLQGQHHGRCRGRLTSPLARACRGSP